MNEHTYDFVAVGIGPFNLGLACLTQPLPDVNGIFLEQRERFDWHPGMLLQDTTLQVPFMADLVTMADPTNRFSFLNYLKEQGRLYSFYIRQDFLVLRNEYNQYCQWAAAQLGNLRFGRKVTHVHYEPERKRYVVTAREGERVEVYYGKRLVLGTGTSPWLPACCQPHAQDLVHSAQYLQRKAELQAGKSITVLGSGQSAAEVVYDLLQEIDTYDYQLNWITRSPRFYPMEYGKLTLEMTSPEYVDYFHGLPMATRDRLNREQLSLYKGINQDLINAIFDTIYAKQTVGNPQVQLRTNSALVAMEPQGEGFRLILHQQEQDRYYKVDTEGVVLATGYKPRVPGFLEDIQDRIGWDEQGRYAVQRNYAIDHAGVEIFVQNGELHTHGYCAPDLGMGAYRNAVLIREMTGREPYKVEQRIAFQEFGVREEEEIQWEPAPLREA